MMGCIFIDPTIPILIIKHYDICYQGFGGGSSARTGADNYIKIVTPEALSS
jgi:hypothetical protein